jgi:hypothetical protein
MGKQFTSTVADDGNKTLLWWRRRSNQQHRRKKTRKVSIVRQSLEVETETHRSRRTFSYGAQVHWVCCECGTQKDRESRHELLRFCYEAGAQRDSARAFCVCCEGGKMKRSLYQCSGVGSKRLGLLEGSTLTVSPHGCPGVGSKRGTLGEGARLSWSLPRVWSGRG